MNDANGWTPERRDHEELGKHFQISANLVFTKRHYRTGILEV